jgi:hypothetical protein
MRLSLVRGLNSKAIALFGAAILVLSSCGGSTAAPVDPVGGVAAAVEAAKSGGILKQMDLVTCLTTGGTVGNAFSGLFGGLTGDALAKAGISPNDLSAAWKVSFDNLQTAQTSLSGDQATVKLPLVVIAPALDAPIGDQGAGEAVASRLSRSHLRPVPLSHLAASSAGVGTTPSPRTSSG